MTKNIQIMILRFKAISDELVSISASFITNKVFDCQMFCSILFDSFTFESNTGRVNVTLFDLMLLYNVVPHADQRGE